MSKRVGARRWMNRRELIVATMSQQFTSQVRLFAGLENRDIIEFSRTRQGSGQKSILKLAGHFISGGLP